MWMAGAAALAAAAGAQDRGSSEPASEPDPAVLYFFFTPDTPDLAAAARAVRASGARVRPVLLADRFRGWPDGFAAALPDLGELALVDEEGLALARRLRISRTPCFVVGRHVAYGSKVDLKEMLTCSR